MANINISVSLDNGASFNGSATVVDNEVLTSITKSLSNIVLDSASPNTQPPASDKESNMASINISVNLDNGSSFNGSATMEDSETLTNIAKVLAEIIRDNTLTKEQPSD